MKAMGDSYTALLADRNALLFQMQSYAACADPEIQEHVREGFADARAPGAGGDRRLPGRPVVVLLPRDAAQRHRRARARGARAGRGVGGLLARPARDALPTRTDARPPRRPDLPPAPALPVGLAGGRARRRLLRRPGVRAARLERRLRRSAARRRRWRSRDIARATGAQRGARPRRARAARRAGRLRGRAAQARPRRGGAEGPGHRSSIRYERGGDRTLVSKDGRSSYVAASFPETPAACSTACSRSSRRSPA